MYMFCLKQRHARHTSSAAYTFLPFHDQTPEIEYFAIIIASGFFRLFFLHMFVHSFTAVQGPAPDKVKYSPV